MKALVENGASIGARDHEGNTPLHDAAVGGNTETIEYLLDNGANVNALNDSNETPMHRAAAYGNLQAVELLAKKGANTSAVSKRGTPLALAEIKGHSAVAKFLKNLAEQENN